MIQLTEDRAMALAFIDELLQRGTFKVSDATKIMEQYDQIKRNFEEGSVIDISNEITPTTNIDVTNKSVSEDNVHQTTIPSNPAPETNHQAQTYNAEMPKVNDSMGLDEDDLPF